MTFKSRIYALRLEFDSSFEAHNEPTEEMMFFDKQRITQKNFASSNTEFSCSNDSLCGMNQGNFV